MKKQLRSFEKAQRAKGYRLNTINGHVNEVRQFLEWAEGENIPIKEVSYTDLLSYIKHCREQTNRKQTINQKLQALKHYFNWQMEEGKREGNPAYELRLRNKIRTVPHDIIKPEKLEKLYKNYPDRGVVGKRNKVILGLFIYQGLRTGEVSALRVEDVNLEDGKIYVPRVGRSNSRKLDLEAHQMIKLQHYMQKVRPALLLIHEKETDKLFTSSGPGYEVRNVHQKLIDHLRKQYDWLKSYKQIRASVITHWLKEYNIRQVQYMIGHRYVSSTERYKTDRLEDLKEQIEELHPLG
jgi:integrase/recombinase XerD